MPRDNLTDTAGIRERIAAFAVGLAPSDIPSEVRRRAIHHMLDGTGIALASGRFDFAHRTLTALRGLGGAGTAPVIGFADRLSPRDAAIVNGVLVHGLDYDDTHLAGVVHPTASLLPVVMAAAEVSGADGTEAVTAFVIGVEVAARLGAVARGGFHQVGFHPTGLVGVFGCTAAAGRLLGLTERQLADAQGIALSMAAGSLEFLADGAWTKRLHPGWAAQAGLTAACLAREGFRGASAPYEGRFGLFNAHLGPERARADPALATAGLGEAWEIMNTAIKPYPACHFTHGAIDAALALAEDGIAPEQIAAVEVLVPAEVVKTVCEPAEAKQRPANSYDAQFSIPYLVASTLIRRRFGLAELEDEAIADPAVLALAARVGYRPDPDSPFPRAYSGEVIVKLNDGSTRRHREHINRGAPERPLSNAEIVAKFRENAALALAPRAGAGIEAAILGLDGPEPAARRFAALGLGGAAR
jgi:2-methylcitrate dehydratase PrpD